MQEANDDVIAGQVPSRAHERFWPAGVPAIDADAVGGPFFIYQGQMIVVINRAGPAVRQIFLNASHAANVEPSWYGEYIGQYEGGDTLVIDTVGLNDRHFVDNYRTQHTSRMHVIKLWNVAADGNTISASICVEDTGALTGAPHIRQQCARARIASA